MTGPPHDVLRAFLSEFAADLERFAGERFFDLAAPEDRERLARLLEPFLVDDRPAPDGPFHVTKYHYNGDDWWHVSRPTAVYVETKFKTQYSEGEAQAVCDALNRYHRESGA